MKYYYNNVPNDGPCRNNLIYTSLISDDEKVFCQWYYNDSEYHKGKNQVVDPKLMNEKWDREIKFLYQMAAQHPTLVPNVLDVDFAQKKIYLEIDGPDFWEQAGCLQENFDKVLPDWQDQMLNIIKAHKELGLFKFSMHPSSYFIIDGKLKSINYFFTYNNRDALISIKDVESHIYSTRQDIIRKHIESLGIVWDVPQPFKLLEKLCWESFSSNYPKEFIEKVKNVI